MTSRDLPPGDDARSLTVVGVAATVGLGVAALPLPGGWPLRFLAGASSFVFLVFVLSRYAWIPRSVVEWLTRPAVAMSCAAAVVVVAAAPAAVSFTSDWSAPSWTPAVAWSGVGTVLFFGVRAIRLFRDVVGVGKLTRNQAVGLLGLILMQGFLGALFMLLLLNEQREPVLIQPSIGMVVGIAAGAVLQTAGEVSEALSSGERPPTNA